jgi:hypothetical protein
MPGRKDRDDKFASFMTGAAQNRVALAATEANLDAAPEINLSTSPSAADNSIFIIPVRTSGTGTVSLELWRQLTRDTPAYTSWIKVGEVLTAATDVEVRFTSLTAAKYKLKCVALTGGSVWDVYEYHNEV